MSDDVSQLHKQMEEALDHLENERPAEAKRVLKDALGLTEYDDHLSPSTPFWLIRVTPEEGEMLLKRFTRARTSASRHRAIMKRENTSE